MPFREAHHVTGRAVKRAEELGVALDALPLDDLQAIDARIDARVYRRAVGRRLGRQPHAASAAPRPMRVRAAIAAARDAREEEA